MSDCSSNWWEHLAAELGLADRVHFPGSLTEEQVRDRLGGGDVFVLASVVAADGQMEGIPVALMEALACGVPVVATRLSGIPELVVDGETGLLAEPSDVAGIADALQRTLADPAGRAVSRCSRSSKGGGGVRHSRFRCAHGRPLPGLSVTLGRAR
ncbi:MAG: glycosyltransferase family 4 protein [Solirubrobacteraceae bacterium]